MSDIVVAGAAGMLGASVVALARGRGHHVVGLSRRELDVTDAGAVAAALADHAPRVVVNCAAYTAVDKAEEDQERAFSVNRDGAGHLARAAVSKGARMVHVSTDFVFDGLAEGPYRPEDTPRPLGVYGRSKLAGEQAVAASGAGHLIVRTSWLYAATGRNFVTAILRAGARGEPLSVVDDQTGSPTWAEDAAELILDLVAHDVSGTWHVAGKGAATWLDLASEALRLSGLDVPIVAVSTEEWGAVAPRPRYSVLDTGKTEQLLGRPMKPWQEALGRCLATR